MHELQPATAVEQSHDGTTVAYKRYERLKCQFEYAVELLSSATAIRFWWTALVEWHPKKTG